MPETDCGGPLASLPNPHLAGARARFIKNYAALTLNGQTTKRKL